MTNIIRHLTAARIYASSHPAPVQITVDDLYDANGDFAYIHQI